MRRLAVLLPISMMFASCDDGPAVNEADYNWHPRLTRSRGIVLEVAKRAGEGNLIGSEGYPTAQKESGDTISLNNYKDLSAFLTRQPNAVAEGIALHGAGQKPASFTYLALLKKGQVPNTRKSMHATGHPNTFTGGPSVTVEFESARISKGVELAAPCALYAVNGSIGTGMMNVPGHNWLTLQGTRENLYVELAVQFNAELPRTGAREISVDAFSGSAIIELEKAYDRLVAIHKELELDVCKPGNVEVQRVGNLSQKLESGTVMDIALSSNGRRILTGAGNGNLRLYDIKSEKANLVHTWSIDHGVIAVALDEKGERAYVASRGGVIAYDLRKTGEATLTSEWKPESGATLYVSDLALSPDGRQLAAAGSRFVVFDTARGKLKRKGKNVVTGSINGVAWTGDGKWIAISGYPSMVVRAPGSASSDVTSKLPGAAAVASVGSKTRFVLGTKSEVLVYDVDEQGKASRVVAHKANEVLQLGASPDGASVVAVTLQGASLWSFKGDALSPLGLILTESKPATVELGTNALWMGGSFGAQRWDVPAG